MNILDHPGVSDLLLRALAEDVGKGDITTAATVEPGQRGRARVIVKEEHLIFCGGPVFERTFALCGGAPKVMKLACEGAGLSRGEVAGEFEGLLGGLLTGERTSLNIVQLMSGIATLTAKYVAVVAGTRAKIIDTRKTHPGLRTLEKYAVRIGGGGNHRFGLDSGVLIKENHIAAAGSIAVALTRARGVAPHSLRLEVECETLAQVEEAARAGADVILLDNMSLDDIGRARSIVGESILLEASGGVSLESVRSIADAGVDLIAVGALTHSARAIDLSMLIETS